MSTYLYGAFDCMFLSCHVRVSECINTLYLPECQGTPCSAYVSKHNSNREKQVILLMIPNGEGRER